jgi:hypothetical protein
VPPQQVPATPWGWIPERNFAPVSGVPEWTDLNPRVGASYDLFGNGRTALKASFGRYVGVLGTDLASANNPINTSVNSVVRTWNDTNGNYVPDCDLGNFTGNGECGAINDTNFGKVNPNATRYDDNLIRGFGKRDYFWDLTAEVQHELGTGLSVQGGYYRNWTDQYSVLGGTSYGGGVTDNLAATSADFDPFCVTAPMDTRLPGGGGYQVCGMYDINPSKFGQVNNLVRQAKDFGERSRVSDFFSVKVDSRFGPGVVLGASVDTGRTVENNCYVVDAPGLFGYSSPTYGVAIPPNTATTIDGKQLCKTVKPFKGQTQVKVHGTYQFPGQVVVSGVLQNLPGVTLQADYPVPNNQIAPSLGRNLAACGARAVCTLTATVPLLVPYTQFEPRRTQLDLRLSKVFQAGRARLQGNLDVYNVFNDSSIIFINNNYGPRWATPVSNAVGSGVLEGRLVQFSGQITF